MLHVPGLSKEQHQPDFQRHQCCSGAVQRVGGLDQNGSTDDSSDLEAGKEKGKQQMAGRAYTGETLFVGITVKSCLPEEGLAGSSLPLNISITVQLTWSWEKKSVSFLHHYLFTDLANSYINHGIPCRNHFLKTKKQQQQKKNPPQSRSKNVEYLLVFNWNIIGKVIHLLIRSAINSTVT